MIKSFNIDEAVAQQRQKYSATLVDKLNMLKGTLSNANDADRFDSLIEIVIAQQFQIAELKQVISEFDEKIAQADRSTRSASESVAYQNYTGR